MATLQTIRNRAGILIAIVIGLALIAFVLGDFLNPGGSSSSSRSNPEIGEVAGEPITFQHFHYKYEEALEFTKQNSNSRNIDQNTQDQIREQIWQQLVRTLVMTKEYEELGITVSNEEVFDMVQGTNIHPQIRRIFANPETGEINPSEILQRLQAIHQPGNEQVKAQWKQIEEDLINQRMYEKYINLIRKGLFVTSQQAETEFNNINHKVIIDFISQQYNNIPDSTFIISENDIKAYYKQHKDDYQQEASRDIEYISFDIKASPEDDKAAKDWIHNIKNEFETDEEIAQFVNLNSDSPFDTKYYKKGELSEIINEFMFNAEKGDTYGPYLENNTYKLARLADIEYLPDSVKARHILIQPQEQTQDALVKAENLADSLKNVIENNGNFAVLARIFSADKGSGQNGGDLGWFKENTMFKPFNDACFFGKKGDIVLVESQLGYHIIEILEKGKTTKKIRVAILERKVEPSTGTIQAIYASASKFGGMNDTYEKFQKAITDQGLSKRIANNLKETDKTIADLKSPREIIRWAFNSDSEEKDISDIFSLEDRFVVVVLTKIREKGTIPVEDLKYDIEIILRKEKEGEKIAEKMNTLINEGKDFEEIASELETDINSAENINFNSYSIPNAGAEPKVIGTAIALNKDQISKPIKGSSGVYMVKINSVSNLEATDFDLEKSRLSSILESRAYYEAFEALKDNANIVDNRVKFY